MTKTAQRNDLSVRAAEKLWASLREAFVNAEKAIEQIIETRAWEPLGYSSFAEAWADRMRGVRLATEATKGLVVYAMFDAGLSDSEVNNMLPIGSLVTPTAVSRMRQQYKAGVPARFVTTRVRAHDRRLPSQPRYLHVGLTPETYAQYRVAAEERGSTIQAEAEKAIRTHFESLLP